MKGYNGNFTLSVPADLRMIEAYWKYFIPFLFIDVNEPARLGYINPHVCLRHKRHGLGKKCA